MFPEISSVKRKRTLAGLSQKELATLSNVSQSMIAKIESGKIEPSYLIIKKIFQTLDDLSRKENKKCKDIMSKKIIFMDHKENVNNASKTMHKHSISQLPIKNQDKIVGTISENILLDKLSSGMEYNKLMNLEIRDIMGPPLPTLNINMSANAAILIVKESGAILILDGEIPKGIISKSDLI